MNLKLFKRLFNRVSYRERIEIQSKLLEGNRLIETANLDNYALNIESAIAAYKQALNSCTEDSAPKLWGSAHNNLANAYLKRTTGKRSDNLEKAIYHCEQALKVRSRDKSPHEWALTQTRLAQAYADRIEGKHAENIEKAIQIFQGLLEIFDQERFAERWATIQNELGAAYSRRIYGDIGDNLEKSLTHYKQAALVLTRQSNPQKWSMLQNNIANVYSHRVLGDYAENLEKAIDFCQQALQAQSIDLYPVDWAMTQSNLGVYYGNRVRGERAHNLERAISHLEQSLRVDSQYKLLFPYNWINVQMNLAACYRRRIYGERASNLEKALFHNEQALTVCSRDPHPWVCARAHNNLATIYSDRVFGNRSENIEQALFYYQQALNVYTYESYPSDWAFVRRNIANTFLDRVEGDKEDNVEQALLHCEQALRVFTPNFASLQWAITQAILADIYAARQKGKKEENIQKAIHHYKQALSIVTIDSEPDRFLEIQRNFGNLLFTEKMWQEAQVAFNQVITANQLLFSGAYTIPGLQHEVEKVAPFFARIAYCKWKTGQLNEAFLSLEQGKTRLMNEVLSLAGISMSQLPLEQQQAIRAARQNVIELEAEMRLPPDTPLRRNEPVLAELLQQARIYQSQLIDEVSQQFPAIHLATLDLLTLLSLVPFGGAMVTPFITSGGGAVFILPIGISSITSDHVLPLPNLTTDYLSKLLQGKEGTAAWGGWLGAYDQFRRNNAPDASENWFTAINQVCQALWETLMGPIHRQLQAFKLAPGAPVLLMPQGGLGVLPLHVAWREVDGEPRYFCDDYTVTYAPSGYALSVSQRRATQSERQARSLFAAINPTGDLPYTPLEGETIANLFPSQAQTILPEGAATTAAYPTAANGRAYLHYSGHGYYHWRDPLQSGLQLADKAYTLADILHELDLSGCRLVTLSACETGITEFQQAPDEYVGLPAGFLQAGAPAVVSTLWAVNDLSTMLLMERFYQLHLQDGLEFAPALRQAQLWLRDVTAGELAERFGEERMKLRGNRLTLAEAGDYWRRFAAMEAESKPFSHPYYWAAFTLTGA